MNYWVGTVSWSWPSGDLLAGRTVTSSPSLGTSSVIRSLTHIVFLVHQLELSSLWGKIQNMRTCLGLKSPDQKEESVQQKQDGEKVTKAWNISRSGKWLWFHPRPLKTDSSGYFWNGLTFCSCPLLLLEDRMVGGLIWVCGWGKQSLQGFFSWFHFKLYSQAWRTLSWGSLESGWVLPESKSRFRLHH